MRQFSFVLFAIKDKCKAQRGVHFDSSLLYRASARVPCIQEDTNSNLDRRLSELKMFVSFLWFSKPTLQYITVASLKISTDSSFTLILPHFIPDLLTSNTFHCTAWEHILLVTGLRKIAHGGWASYLWTPAHPLMSGSPKYILFLQIFRTKLL
jgi:hypothetical protein